MALRDTKWAWDQALPPTTKLVLLALGHCVNSMSRGACYPGQEHLADMCGITDRHVRRILNDLVDLGIVQTTHRPGEGAGRKTNLYRLVQDQGELDLPCVQPVDKSRGNRTPRSGCQGGATGHLEQATGHPGPVATIRGKGRVRREEERGATQHTTSPRPSTPAPKTLSQAPEFDFLAIARKIRPDIADPGPCWAKFLAYHIDRPLDPATAQGAWALWISREVDNHHAPCIITAQDRPFGSFLDRANPVLNVEVTEDSHERPRSARV